MPYIADRRALAKFLSLYDIPDKYIKVISAMYENNVAAQEMRSATGVVLSHELSRVVFYPLYIAHLIDFVLRSTA